MFYLTQTRQKEENPALNPHKHTEQAQAPD